MALGGQRLTQRDGKWDLGTTHPRVTPKVTPAPPSSEDCMVHTADPSSHHCPRPRLAQPLKMIL